MGSTGVPTSRSLGRVLDVLGTKRSTAVVAQPGVQVHGTHEVTGSIPVSSTNSSNNLAARHVETQAALCLRCVYSAAERAELRPQSL